MFRTTGCQKAAGILKEEEELERDLLYERQAQGCRKAHLGLSSGRNIIVINMKCYSLTKRC